MPGGGNKFTVRYDNMSRLYLSLTNPSIDRYGGNPDARNILMLVRIVLLCIWKGARARVSSGDTSLKAAVRIKQFAQSFQSTQPAPVAAASQPQAQLLIHALSALHALAQIESIP